MRFIRKISTVQTVTLSEAFKLPSNSNIVSGIQPTGTFHLGNYFGAIKSWQTISHIKDANKFFFVADLHSLTVSQNYTNLNAQRTDAFASIISCGINPQDSTIYHQSSVPEITTIQWILSCFTNMGYLNRMTQWKSKANLKETSNISSSLGSIKLGLFSYPVLMSSDILTFRANYVPVGQDQAQHLELTREIAQSFNKGVGTEFFQLPNTLLTPTKKILSLKNPSKKMSKSDPEPLSKIFINDSKEEIIKKLNKATTDSIEGKLYYDMETRPAVSNLIGILASCLNKSVEETVKDVENLSKKEFKMLVAENLIVELEEPKRKYHELISDPDYLNRLSARGTENAREVANKTLKEITKVVGMSSY